MVDSPWDPTGPDYGMNAGAFLDDPRLRTALLSSGLALMGTPQWGQNVTSQLASAIGTGGEAVAHQEAMDIKKQEAESKEALREAQANVAGARAGSQADRLAFQRYALQQQSENQLAARQTQTMGHYITYQKGANAINEKRSVMGEPPLPVKPYTQWLQEDFPLVAARFGIPAVAAPGAPGAPAAATSQDDQALAWAEANPTDPRAIEIKKRLGR